jgi:hypothetical protein
MHPPWPHPVFSDIPAHTGLRSAPPGRHREVVDEFAGGCLVGERAPEAMMASPVTTRNALPGADRVSWALSGLARDGSGYLRKEGAAHHINGERYRW